MKKLIKCIIRTVLLVIVVSVIIVLYHFNYIPHKKYSDADFNISKQEIVSDKDGDGIDDVTDVLLGAKSYVATKPKYKSIYYSSGYPNDEHGVCTDVVAFGLLNAGYDLMNMVYDDIWEHRDMYEIDVVDVNIDFRRVENLQVFFANNYIPLTNDVYDIEQWQGGDVVLFGGHVGIVSDARNRKGVSFLIHNGSPFQAGYEQDVLATYGNIVGHYRICDEYKIEE